jgi:hypothetical protein
LALAVALVALGTSANLVLVGLNFCLVTSGFGYVHDSFDDCRRSRFARSARLFFS